MTPRYNSHDKDLPTIFKDIRQAKEGKARQTIEERRRENEERRKTFSKRLNFFKRNRQEDDSVDLDAEEAWIQSEIEKVRAGEIHKYDQTQFVQSESMEEDSAAFYSDYNASEPEEPILDVDSYLLSAEQGEKEQDSESSEILETASQSEEPSSTEVQQQEVTVELEGPCDSDEVSESASAIIEPDESESEDLLDVDEFVQQTDNTQSEADSEPVTVEDRIQTANEQELDFDLDLEGAAVETTTAYIAVMYDDMTHTGAWMWSLLEPDGKRTERKNLEVSEQSSEGVLFAGASELLQYILSTGETSLIIRTDKDAAELLRRNATYGMTGYYGKRCVEFIRIARAAAGKCYLRVLTANDDEYKRITNNLCFYLRQVTEQPSDAENEDAGFDVSEEQASDTKIAAQPQASRVTSPNDSGASGAESEAVINFDF